MYEIIKNSCTWYSRLPALLSGALFLSASPALVSHPVLVEGNSLVLPFGTSPIGLRQGQAAIACELRHPRSQLGAGNSASVDRPMPGNSIKYEGSAIGAVVDSLITGSFGRNIVGIGKRQGTNFD